MTEKIRQDKIYFAKDTYKYMFGFRIKHIKNISINNAHTEIGNIILFFVPCIKCNLIAIMEIIMYIQYIPKNMKTN